MYKISINQPWHDGLVKTNGEIQSGYPSLAVAVDDTHLGHQDCIFPDRDEAIRMGSVASEKHNSLVTVWRCEPWTSPVNDSRFWNGVEKVAVFDPREDVEEGAYVVYRYTGGGQRLRLLVLSTDRLESIESAKEWENLLAAAKTTIAVPENELAYHLSHSIAYGKPRLDGWSKVTATYGNMSVVYFSMVG